MDEQCLKCPASLGCITNMVDYYVHHYGENSPNTLVAFNGIWGNTGEVMSSMEQAWFEDADHIIIDHPCPGLDRKLRNEQSR